MQNYAVSYDITTPNKFGAISLIKSNSSDNEKLVLTSIRSFLAKQLDLTGYIFYIVQYTNRISKDGEIAFKLIKGNELFEPENERLLFPVF